MKKSNEHLSNVQIKHLQGKQSKKLPHHPLRVFSFFSSYSSCSSRHSESETPECQRSVRQQPGAAGVCRHRRGQRISAEQGNHMGGGWTAGDRLY